MMNHGAARVLHGLLFLCFERDMVAPSCAKREEIPLIVKEYRAREVYQ
jgi:hypothetical protein